MTAVTDRWRIAVPRVLREYALLAGGERGALLGPHGSLSWVCFPGWDRASVNPGLAV